MNEGERESSDFGIENQFKWEMGGDPRTCRADLCVLSSSLFYCHLHWKDSSHILLLFLFIIYYNMSLHNQTILNPQTHFNDAVKFQSFSFNFLFLTTIFGCTDIIHLIVWDNILIIGKLLLSLIHINSILKCNFIILIDIIFLHTKREIH